MVAGALGITFLALLLTELSGATVRFLVESPGPGTPRPSEYSYAASLAARGRVEEAVAAYRAGETDHPRDPEPCLRVARLLRDELGRVEAAASAFRRARDRVAKDPARSLAVTRELVELYLHRSDMPRGALPELARMAHDHPGTPQGEWATAELRRLKAELMGDETPPSGRP